MDATLTSERDGETCRLKVSGELSIYCAAELKPQLLGLLGSCQELEINLSDVAELDCAGFQLLYLLKREAKHAGKQLRLVAHSSATLEVLELLRMEAYFGDPVVLAS